MVLKDEPAGQREAGGPDKPPPEKAAPPPRARRTAFLRLGIGAALAALLAFGWWLHARQFEETDDAQVDGDISSISPRVTGTVAAVRVADNQAVKKGEVLVELDPADLQVSLLQARAQVAQAEAQLSADTPGVDMTRTSNQASLSSAQSELASVQAALDGGQKELLGARAQLVSAEATNRFAQQQKTRGEQLVAGGVITKADFDQRTAAADSAAAAVEGAKEAVAAARERIDQRKAALATARARLGETAANAPRSLATRKAGLTVRQANLDLANAQLQQAELNLAYARIAAPVDGIVGKKSVNVGDRVQPGQQLFALTHVGSLWITANYRETQLGLIKPGQRATIHVDALGREYEGAVESIAGATGSRYSLLPPENASGNYVKVVQRVPVRIKLDPGQPELERLRPGMSVEPKVRIR